MSCVIFGAGKIARGFIAHLLSLSDIDFVFVEKADALADLINEREQYTINILGAPEKNYVVKNAKALKFSQEKEITEAIAEAEAYPGPSLIIAYAPCINHGIKKGMAKAQTEEELAVKCGYWHNFRFNPAADKKFALDSKTPDMENYMDFLNGEVRYNSLQRQNPEKAARLFAKNESEAKARYAYLNKLVAMYGEEE